MVHPPPEDVRSARPYLLRRNPLKAFVRRAVSIAALIAIDITGLTIGLYIALVLRSVVRDPSPILWNLLWKAEADWLPFLVLLTVLVFWRNRLYGQRELREGAGRIVPSVLLVTALALAFAIGTDQHFTTFGLYLVAAIAIATMISLLRWSYETLTGSLMRSFGVRRRVLLVGDEGQTEHLRDTIGASRSGIDYQFAGHVPFGPEVLSALQAEHLDEVIVADDGIDETELLEIVDAGPPARGSGADRAADDAAPRRPRRVRARSGGADLRRPPADPRRGRLGAQADVRPRHRDPDRRDRTAALAADRAR